jgi:hypothetical protein
MPYSVVGDWRDALSGGGPGGGGGGSAGSGQTLADAILNLKANGAEEINLNVNNNGISISYWYDGKPAHYDEKGIWNVGEIKQGHYWFGNNGSPIVNATLQGSYNWKVVGNAYVASIYGLYVYAAAIKKGWGSLRFDFSNACVTLPKYNLKNGAAADQTFNAAWNAAALELDVALNTWPASEPALKYPTEVYAKPFFLNALRLNLEAFNSGANFSPNYCKGDIPASYARYHEIGKP